MKHTWIQVVVSAVLLFSVAWLVSGQTLGGVQAQGVADPEDPVEPRRTISVSGTGQASAQPDLAVVVLGVEVQAEEASEALSENSQRMQAVIAALRDEGVASADIQTQAIRLDPRYEQPAPRASGAQQGPPQLVGFVATNTVEVRVRDLENLGALLDASVQAGGNQIQGIRFQVETPTKLYDGARQAAWTDALRKAEQLAGLAEAELGPVLTIGESTQTPGPVVEQAALGLGGGASVPIEPGSQLVQVDLQVTWQLVVPSEEMSE